MKTFKLSFSKVPTDDVNDMDDLDVSVGVHDGVSTVDLEVVLHDGADNYACMSMDIDQARALAVALIGAALAVETGQ